MKKIIAFCLLLVFLVGACKNPVCGDGKCAGSEQCPADCFPSAPPMHTTGSAQVAQGWSSPVKVVVSDQGWEDSAYISADGENLYFAYYPSDLITDFSKGKFSDDIDVYVSKKPFVAKQKLTEYYLGEDIWSEVGPMLDGSDIYYNSNRDYLRDQHADTDIYLNDQRLPFNDILGDEREFGNPHYCAKNDELWFDEKDTSMWVLYNAKANGFSGTPQPASAPLQVDGFANFQPFLTQDCNTIFFSSNRGDVLSKGPAIYMSSKDSQGVWSSPVPIVWAEIGVGEPTLTADGKQLFFVQLFKENNVFTTDIYYTSHTPPSN